MHKHTDRKSKIVVLASFVLYPAWNISFSSIFIMYRYVTILLYRRKGSVINVEGSQAALSWSLHLVGGVKQVVSKLVSCLLYA